MYLGESRKKDYGDEIAENWEDLETIGLSDKYKETLGEIEVVTQEEIDTWSALRVVWHFKDHSVYIEGNVDDGSYGVGYKLEPWTLKEVFPVKREITIYE